jgi:hypothetical protein
LALVPKHLKQVLAQVMQSAVVASQENEGQLQENGEVPEEAVEPTPHSVHWFEFGPVHLRQDAWQSCASPFVSR